jgi:hypothetical protein
MQVSPLHAEQLLAFQKELGFSESVTGEAKHKQNFGVQAEV